MKGKPYLVYASDIDLSDGKGPSVNELEFVDALVRSYSGKLKIVTVMPTASLRKFVAERIVRITFWRHSRKNPASLLAFELILFCVIAWLSVRHRPIFIFRLSYFPIAVFLLAPIVKGRFHIKTVGDGKYRYLERLPCGAMFVAVNRIMYRHIMRYVHSVDMVTETHKSSFGEKIGWPEKCHVVDNKVNVEVFSPKDREKCRKHAGLEGYEYVIGYAGGDPFNRGARELLLALPAVRQRTGMRIGALVVGPFNELPGDIHDDLLQGVVLTGKVPYVEVPDLINAMDVGVSFLPAWHRGASEQKVRQYLACGVVPVVTPGGSEFVGRDGVGFVCDNENIEDVVEALANALMSARDMSARCRKYAVDYLSHYSLVSDRLRLLGVVD